MNRVCVGCRKSFPLKRGKSRCPTCEQDYQARRNAERPQYGPGWDRLSRETIEAEPWCHFPGGCGRRDAGTADNPLTCQHILAVALGGTNDPSNLTVWCRWHNSSDGGRTRAALV